ncbi:DUF3108 domain-containing protein [Marinicauda algicola]|nr:DUF3108 domain-containing protein [Marinicauda algicola]
MHPALLAVLPSLLALAPAVPAHGTLEIEARYAATVWAIPVGRVDLTAELGADAYAARSVSEAAGLAALFTDVRIESEVEGEIAGGRAKPARYAHDEYTGRKHRRIDMSFEGGVARSVASPDFSNWGEPPASETDRAGAIDPMTAVLLLSQSMTGRQECSGRLPVFDGRLRYDLDLRPRGREQIRTRAWQGEAIVCDAFYEPISGYTDEQRPDPGDLRHPLTLWLAPMEGGHHLPVRVQTRAGFGVHIELRSLDIAPRQ